MSKLSLLSNNQIKLLAMLFMLIDHIGMILFPKVLAFRMIGRLAMPLFAYMIAEGCAHTRSRTRYLTSMAVFAVLCQGMSSLVTGKLYQNILVTFSLSVAVIFSIDRLRIRRDAIHTLIALTTIGGAVCLTVLLPRLVRGFDIDYGLFGVLLPVAVYYAPTKPYKLIAAATVLTAQAFLSTPLQWFSLAALPLLMLYNGKRGTYRLKYLFYVFYPLHLACLYLIGEWIR